MLKLLIEIVSIQSNSDTLTFFSFSLFPVSCDVHHIIHMFIVLCLYGACVFVSDLDSVIKNFV